MKLVRRLTAFLLAAFTLVLAADTWASVRSHLALFDEDMRRDDARLARVLALAAEQEWAGGGEAAVRRLLASLGSEGDGVQASLVPAPDGALADTTASYVGAGASRQLVTRAALHVRSATPFALEISESLAHERSYALARIRQAVVTTLLAVLASGLVAWGVGVRVVGRPIEALVAKARRVARGDFGSPLALRPDTELALLAREMNDMAAQLGSALREIEAQTAARVAAQEQLRHADRLTTVGKLASGLAHELGTPLGVVSGRAKMIASGEAEGADEVADCARIIVAQADRMASLVRELLGFARRRGGEKRPVDLAALAREAVALLQPLGAKRGVRVIALPCQGALRVPADASQIQQAVMNLVMNGVQASAPGGEVRVSIEPHAEPAPGRLAREGSFAAIVVEDEGSGIAPELQEQVFDPFFTTKAPGEGTGLGLSVAHGIATDHGGWIDVKSALGRGSRFRLALPRSAA